MELPAFITVNINRKGILKRKEKTTKCAGGQTLVVSDWLLGTMLICDWLLLTIVISDYCMYFFHLKARLKKKKLICETCTVLNCNKWCMMDFL